MKIKLLLKKIVFHLFEPLLPPDYFTEMLIEEGFDIGRKTVFYSPKTQAIDRQRPWMLHIGDYCKITRGVVILTHDYSRSVLRRKYGDVLGEAGFTSIGDNVFIGVNSVIMMGAKIGNNVIIGAGSVVSGEIPDNTVAAGNPARVIRSLEEHYAIRKKRCRQEALLYANSFAKKYGRYPSLKEMDMFFPLYLPRDRETLINSGVNYRPNGDESEEIIAAFLQTEPLYENYQAFLNDLDPLEKN